MGFVVHKTLTFAIGFFLEAEIDLESRASTRVAGGGV